MMITVGSAEQPSMVAALTVRCLVMTVLLVSQVTDSLLW